MSEEMFVIQDPKTLRHYGILRKSGRYPWGSGGNVVSRSRRFLDIVKELEDKGWSPATIAKSFSTEDVPFTTTDLRAAKSIAKNQKKAADIAFAQKLRDKGMSPTEIGKRMDMNESSVRALLAPGARDKADKMQTIADFLKSEVDAGHYVDIGKGVENRLGISETNLKIAAAMLKEEGYRVINVQTDQLTGGGNKTLIKTLVPPGTTYGDIKNNMDKIRIPNGYSEDGGRTILGLHPPLSIDQSRVAVRYKEDGGDQADGVIYVRRGVDDVSLGGKNYAQVRIMVDDTHYLKGMAMYRDDLPKGVDLVFNTNKSSTGNKLDAMKELKRDVEGNVDPDNPFGSMISRQITETTGGTTKVKSVMNLVNEEGKWDEWSRNLSSQFLSKQQPSLIKQQLDKAYAIKKDELDEINALTNPVIKKKLLDGFASDADSAAVHMKAAAIPKQRTQVILPINQMKDTEVYAPNFPDGTRVALVRFPHGGKFEIPELVVNNRQPDAKKILGQATDAIGINHRVAARLSGADFDGDTVLVIPNNSGQVKSTPPLRKLEGFDPQREYKGYPGMPKMANSTLQTEMGKVSNLITDMTIRGASDDELAHAVKHSMVVIDAKKHELDYKRSAIENGIPALTKKYQSPYTESGRPGASTLISRKKQEDTVPEHKPRGIDPATGKIKYAPEPTTYKRRDGTVVTKTTNMKKIHLVDDVNDLSSGTIQEKLYADHSNRMKALADTARKELANTKTNPYNPSAAKTYKNEVTQLKSALDLANRNRPLERQAQLLAKRAVTAKRQAHPDMEKAEVKKLEASALKEMRHRLGIGDKTRIEFTPEQWTAIQAGAVSPNMLSELLKNANLDRVKELATPRSTVLMTSSKEQRAKSLLSSGLTQAEVAEILGVSLTTLKRSIGGT